MMRFFFISVLFFALISSTTKCESQNLNISIKESDTYQIDVLVKNNLVDSVIFDKCPVTGQVDDFSGYRVKTILEVYIHSKDSSLRKNYFDRLPRDYTKYCPQYLKSGETIEFTFNFGPDLYRYIDSKSKLSYKLHVYYFSKGEINHNYIEW